MEAKSETLNRLRLPEVSAELLQCPSCEKQLKPYEVAQHCEQETERLRRMQLESNVLNEMEENSHDAVESTEERRKPWSVFQKVQRNRQSRLRQRTRKRPIAAQAPPPQRCCPVCNKNFAQDEIEQHAEECLRRSDTIANGRNGHLSSEEDEEEEYEEYEWAGQKRIRVSSLLQGGYAAIGIGQIITYNNGSGRPQETVQTDEDEDLNVDEDDTHIYGPPQYGESDIISPMAECSADGNEEGDVVSYMRRLITEGSSSGNGGTEEECNVINSKSNGLEKDPNTATTSNGVWKPNKSNTLSTTTTTTTSTNTIDNTKVQQQIIESLKAKLRLYENQLQSKFKCLICLDDYRNPAISVSCWHVHCEKCWLRSLGARKLCPQCNLITTPKDLRRIYM